VRRYVLGFAVLSADVMRWLSPETVAIIEAHAEARRAADIEARRRLVERLEES